MLFLNRQERETMKCRRSLYEMARLEVSKRDSWLLEGSIVG